MTQQKTIPMRNVNWNACLKKTVNWYNRAQHLSKGIVLFDQTKHVVDKSRKSV